MGTTFELANNVHLSIILETRDEKSSVGRVSHCEEIRESEDLQCLYGCEKGHIVKTREARVEEEIGKEQEHQNPSNEASPSLNDSPSDGTNLLRHLSINMDAILDVAAIAIFELGKLESYDYHVGLPEISGNLIWLCELQANHYLVS